MALSTESTTSAATAASKSAARSVMTKLGTGSGVDTATLAESLVEAERAPRKASLDASIRKGENRISGYSAMLLNLDTIRAAFKSLDDPSDVNTLQSSSSSTAVGAAAGATATAGVHSVEVLALAKPQKNVSVGFAAAGTQINSGQEFFLRLTGNGATQNVRVTGANATPQGMVNSINNAKLGVTAQLVNTNDGSASPFKIVLTGTEGAQNAFTISTDDGTGTAETQNLTLGAAARSGNITVGGVTVAVIAGDSATIVATKVKAALDADSDKKSLGRSITQSGAQLTINFSKFEGNVASIAFNDAGTTGVTANGISTDYIPGSAVPAVDFSTSIQAAADARLNVNGLELRRSSNVVNDAIGGLTLTLSSLSNGTPATINIARDTVALKTKLETLVRTFNDAMSDFRILTGPKNTKDETDIYSGSLQNDSTVNTVRNQLRAMFLNNSTSPGSSVRALRDLGVSINKEGTLEFDEKKFTSTTETNFSEIVTALTADRANKSDFGSQPRGIAGEAVKRINDMMKSTGMLATQTASTQKQIDRYKADLEQLEDRMKKLLTSYQKSFAVMDTIVSQSSATQARLKAQFTQRNDS
jgi:flagellar hook-associated protein 2